MSISKVAEIAGVSNTTVSFVINNKPGISQDTVDKVWAAIRKTGYVPRGSAARKNQASETPGLKTRNIGLLMPEGVMSTIPFYARLFEAIHKELDKRELNMSPIRCSNSDDLSKSSFNDLDGLMLCNYVKNITDLISFPFVTILGHPDVEDKLNADHIEPANDKIGVIAASYLVNRGHKKVLSINPSITYHPAMVTRCQYFTDYVTKKGAEAETMALSFTERDKYGRLRDGMSVDNVREFVLDFKNRKDRPTAIFIPCDSHMVIVQKAFAAEGINPGEDVEFVGCNNESILLDGMEPRPTTIDINPQAMARAALVALLQRIKYPDSYDNIYKVVSIEPSLVLHGAGVREKW
jgi:LacI family transcriptional regulator